MNRFRSVHTIIFSKPIKIKSPYIHYCKTVIIIRGDLFLIKRSLPGILSGLIIFIILLFVFIVPNFQNNDFNEQLIQKVSNGESADILIPQIENQSIYEKQNLTYTVNQRICNINKWGNGTLASQTDYMYETRHYKKINLRNQNYKILRIEYAKREISKEEFLQEITDLNY
jgi:hypothetical protein